VWLADLGEVQPWTDSAPVMAVEAFVMTVGSTEVWLPRTRLYGTDKKCASTSC
jgi:hypothetical protein